MRQYLYCLKLFIISAFIIPFVADGATVSLLKSLESLGQDTHELWVGFQFETDEGEKIQANLQSRPQIRLHNASNASIQSIRWPAVRVADENSLNIEFFDSPCVIPVLLSLTKSEQPVRLIGKISYIACGNLCMPQEVDFNITIPRHKHKIHPEAKIIEQALLHRASKKGESSLLLMMIFGLLGGAILNLMPCVLPVLGLKFMSILSLKRSALLKSGYLATIIGILFSFWGLALAASLLRAAGVKAGWGMHFQQPAFLILMMIIVFIFSLNLFGIFEITLPSFIRKRIDKMDLSNKSQILKSFLSGVLATLLATPCTAPFLGVSVGFAMTQDITDTFLIFTAIGLGFSVPYWLLMILPAKFIPHPKPGKWMRGVRYTLGLLLLGTGIWLGFVLYSHTNNSALITKQGLSWEAFEPRKIHSLVQSGRKVFVYITANWCLTCKLNEQYLERSDALIQTLTKPEMYLMKADWTARDESVSTFLEKHNRSGIPFTVVFTPSNPQGVILPEILTQEAIANIL